MKKKKSPSSSTTKIKALFISALMKSETKKRDKKNPCTKEF